MFANFSPSSLLRSAADDMLVHIQERVVEAASSYLQERAQQILYVGAGLSFLAIVAALIARAVLSVFFAMGATCCFRLTLWAFQERERLQAEELFNARANLQRELFSSQDCSEKNKRLAGVNGNLEKKNQELMEGNEKLYNQIDRLEKQNAELLKDAAALTKAQEETNEQILELQGRIFRLTSPGQFNSPKKK